MGKPMEKVITNIAIKKAQRNSQYLAFHSFNLPCILHFNIKMHIGQRCSLGVSHHHHMCKCLCFLYGAAF